jgi:hypothetical protein
MSSECAVSAIVGILARAEIGAPAGNCQAPVAAWNQHHNHDHTDSAWRSVMMPAELYLSCPACARRRVFEQPPCADGHGAECAERVCVTCGAAVFLGPAIADAPRRHSGTERRAA